MKILIIRFSALGDVAMTIPVVASFAQQYPEIEITFLSKSFVEPLFGYMPSNFHFWGLKPGDYEDFPSLLQLYGKLRKEKFDAVADLHDVLRTKVIRTLLCLNNVRIAHINKGRKEKKALTRKKDKIMRQLPTSFMRYGDVFRQLGYPFEITFHSVFKEGKGEIGKFIQVIGDAPNKKPWIGIAPFATHKGKMLPKEKITRLIKLLSIHDEWKIFLFGGKAEKDMMEEWALKYPNIESIAGKLKLDEELALISYLKVMVSMDSANMHLASLTGIPVVSIWGATHYYAGFMGWKQKVSNAVETDLVCRPCSIFGNKTCFRKDYACLQRVTPEMIVSKIEKIVNS